MSDVSGQNRLESSVYWLVLGYFMTLYQLLTLRNNSSMWRDVSKLTIRYAVLLKTVLAKEGCANPRRCA
jgi:hypothetical protein